TIRSALRYPDFRWLLSALAVSQVGDWLYNLALAVLVYQRTHSALWVGVTTAIRVVPVVVLGPLAGRVSRRLGSRSVLAAALATAGAPTLLLAGVRWPAAAIVLTGLTGMGALLVEVLTETTLQRELDEDVFGRAYGIAFPAAIAGIVVGSVIAP